MGSARQRRVPVRRALTVAVGCVLAASCATARPQGARSAALFKAQVGDIAGGVAPGPHSVWYVQDQPVSYVKLGVATWQPDHSHGLRGWFARHFGRHARPSEATGIAAANLALPVPSRVQVTNIASGQMITVRVEDKAPMSDGVIRLSADAAKGLGVEPGKPLMIRMRYLAPVIAYQDRGALRYAGRRATKPAEPPTLLAQAKPPVTVAAAAPAKPPAALITPQPAVLRVADQHAPPLQPAAPQLRAAMAPEAPTAGFRVQAGAFASLDNAHKAVAMLSGAGAAVIEPMKRGTGTLYRVIVPGAKDAQAAARLRQRVADAGFADARVLKPL